MALNHTTIEKYLPKYDGDRETLDFFIEQVTVLARAADPDARALFPIILKSKLRGEAIKAVAHVPNGTVDEIIQALNLKFGDNRSLEQIISEITRIKRTFNVSQLEFADKIKKLLYAAKNKAKNQQAQTILENVCIDQLCKNLDLSTDRLIRAAEHSTFDEAYNHLKHELELHPEYFASKLEKINSWKSPRNSNNNFTQKFNGNEKQFSHPIRPVWQNTNMNPISNHNAFRNNNANNNRPVIQNNNNWANIPRPTPEQWRQMFQPQQNMQQSRQADQLDSDISMRTVGKKSYRSQTNKPTTTAGINNIISDNIDPDDVNCVDFFQESLESQAPV